MSKKQRPTIVPQPRRFPPVTFAVLSGLLLGAAFPPIDCKWLVWIGLVPLLFVILQNPSSGSVFLYGYIAGFVFFLMNLHPLVSAHSWTGWAAESTQAFARRMTQQWWFMQGIWMGFALWCAVWCGVWALLLKQLSKGHGWRMLVLAPVLWVVGPEWIRSHTTFGFAWGFLGNATADLMLVRQLAALGGVWLLSALVVVVNVGIANTLLKPSTASRQQVSMASAFLLVAASLFGIARLRQRSSPGQALLTAVLQRAKPSYTTEDFARPTGFDRGYVPMIEQALAKKAQLIMLPESIALGTMTLDASASSTKPVQWQHARAAWEAQMAMLLKENPATIIVGLDTVEHGEDHNTLVAWNKNKTLGWYHKRRLVPFAEYQPWVWAPWAIHGKSEYSPGNGSQLIKLSQEVVLGGFICQEVLFPWVVRNSVRDGATVLVSGGNDGVFGDPAVALVHADAAQIRAVETGRFIVRAMKTGISQVLDPFGQELVRSRSAEPVLLMETIVPQSGLTPYIRYGNWVVYLSFLLILVYGIVLPQKK